MEEMRVKDWYRYSCAIPFLFEFEGKKRIGTIVLGFEHENIATGKCDIFFQNLL